MLLDPYHLRVLARLGGVCGIEVQEPRFVRIDLDKHIDQTRMGDLRVYDSGDHLQTAEQILANSH